MDEAGHITGANLANRVMAESREYYSEGTMASVEVDGPLGRIHAHYYDGYDDFMNLISERNGVTGLSKSYRYDTLNRLESYSFSNTNPTFSATVNYAYDKVGNFLKKTDYSANAANAYRYGGSACAANSNAGPNAVCQLTKLNGTTVSFQYDKRGNLRVGDGLTMTYNAMDKPLSVSGRGATTSFVYGSDSMRAKQSRNVSGSITTTYYVDKYYEVDSDGSWRAYLDDIAVLSYTPTRKHLLHFTLRDRLGSATTMADQNGNIVSQRYFDPFGRTAAVGSSHRTDILNKNTLLSRLQDLDITNKNRRGFTDHEHLNEQQLIHMNGRIYDYNLGRFMSVDPFIQAPTSTQSVNPYSYIMNNPLAGTDPTGYCSTGTSVKGRDAYFCHVALDPGGDAVGQKKKKDAKVTHSGAPMGQQDISTDLEPQERNGPGQIAAESIQHINSVSDYLKPFKFPDNVVQMAEFCRGYPCGGGGEVVPSLFIDDLLGLGLKSVILMPMKAIAAHADETAAVGMRLSDVAKEVPISKAKYGEAADHIADAQKAGHPDVLTIARDGASANRNASIGGYQKFLGSNWMNIHLPCLKKVGGVRAFAQLIQEIIWRLGRVLETHAEASPMVRKFE